MDSQFWIYVVIAVIYFVSRMLKKPEQATGESVDTQPAERRSGRHTSPPTAEIPRQLTFEELLREITSGKEVQRTEPGPVRPAYESYEKDPGEEARSLEDVDFNEADNAGRWKPYEEIPVRSGARQSLEETLRLQDTVMDFGKFSAFQQKSQQKITDTYIKIIRNPESLKQAVVMSEILKKKF